MKSETCKRIKRIIREMIQREAKEDKLLISGTKKKDTITYIDKLVTIEYEVNKGVCTNQKIIDVQSMSGKARLTKGEREKVFYDIALSEYIDYSLDSITDGELQRLGFTKDATKN